MKSSVWFWGAIEGVIWYGFIYYLLFALKNPVELWFASLVLLVLVFAGTMACPWVHNSQAWRRMLGKEE